MMLLALKLFKVINCNESDEAALKMLAAARNGFFKAEVNLVFPSSEGIYISSFLMCRSGSRRQTSIETGKVLKSQT